MRFLTLAAVVLLAATLPVLAHTDGDGEKVANFITGFWHPILGWDHVVAMVAVGLWGAILGAPAIWVLPLVFPLVMALGGALGVLGVPIPAVEIGIAGSGLVLGLLVALWVKAPIWVAAVIVGTFAIFHGHAHGTEMPNTGDAIGYGIGFVVGTGLLHGVGIALGMLTALPKGSWVVRGAGGIIALAGAAFLTGVA